MDKEKTAKNAKLRFLVIIATILILAAWAFNLKHELRLAEETIDKNAAQEALELKTEMDNTVDEMEKKFQDLTDKVEVPVENSTSSPTGMPEAPAYCPEYINCMPTIGEARPCVIPPGCEEKTLIAY